MQAIQQLSKAEMEEIRGGFFFIIAIAAAALLVSGCAHTGLPAPKTAATAPSPDAGAKQ